MTIKLLRIASRNSPLALKQTEIVKNHLLKLYPDLKIEIVGMTTEGDRLLGMPLAKVGGKGLFVKALEDALLEKKADIAVHSMKDVPTKQPRNLIVHTICEREDPRDVFISNHYLSLEELPLHAHVGTASLRRQTYLKNLRPDLKISTLRGNLQTRLRKLDEGEFDGIILAAAGLKRLDLSNRIRHYLDPYIFIPAVGQGALGIECRRNDRAIQKLLQPLHHQETAICVIAERTFNHILGGGCQVPVAAYGIIEKQQLYLRGMVGQPDGSIMIRGISCDKPNKAKNIAKKLATTLLEHGADKILKDVYANYG